MTDPEIRNQLTVLTAVVGVVAALAAATLSITINLAYQVGQINGQLAVLISHVVLRL